jgi:hypothetical protein
MVFSGQSDSEVNPCVSRSDFAMLTLKQCQTRQPHKSELIKSKLSLVAMCQLSQQVLIPLSSWPLSELKNWILNLECMNHSHCIKGNASSIWPNGSAVTLELASTSVLMGTKFYHETSSDRSLVEWRIDSRFIDFLQGHCQHGHQL